ncbi:hypothetical protein H4R99_004901 [Coemansia sp. RSA 1722]|nr:hypothetical protein H4R99_004901 [Coemansia sp. RSA 1722]
MIIPLLLVSLLLCSAADASAYAPRRRVSVAQAQHRQRPLFVASASRQEAENDDWRQQMLEMLNDIRRKAGLQEIAQSPRVDQIAQDHSDYQAAINQMTHDDAHGSLGKRFTQAGILWSAVAENVAFGSQTVNDTMDMWVNSPSHYDNMVGNYTLVGFGRALNSSRHSQYDIYWTQEFVYPWTFNE